MLNILHTKIAFADWVKEKILNKVATTTTCQLQLSEQCNLAFLSVKLHELTAVASFRSFFSSIILQV